LAAAGPAPKSDKTTARDDGEAESAFDGRRLKRETDVPNPLSPYGRSKLAGERELLRFADATPTTILRPPYVFGPGDVASTALFKMAKNQGLFVIPGWRDRFYSFVAVDDLATLLIAAAERGERAEPTSLDPIDGGATCSGRGVYFSTSFRPVRFSEYGAAVEKAYGRKKKRTQKVPPLAVWGAGAFSEIMKIVAKKAPPLDWNKAIEALNGPWICSGEKAARDLGVRLETPLAEQFAATAEWYLREGWV
jgi:nucleoside-diphosphate-sugar epimerase